MEFDKKGILAPYTIITSILTGAVFSLIGSLVAFNLNLVKLLYLEGIALVVIGGFLAHWILAHTIHDIYHIDIEERVTFSKKTLKILLILSTIILLLIAIYLTIKRGWPVMVFAVIGAMVCIYAEGLPHYRIQMAIGSMFLVIGGFYVQVGTLNLDYIIWFKVICMALFAFVMQYGWISFYRLDDYGWSRNTKNKSILITKTALFFLVLYLIL